MAQKIYVSLFDLKRYNIDNYKVMNFNEVTQTFFVHKKYKIKDKQKLEKLQKTS